MSSTLQRSAAYAAMALCAVGAALLLGRDANWDMLNYHVYAGYSALENRFGADYFAASTQGYFNPYSHVPLYLMIAQGFAPALMVGLLALFHSLNLLIVYEAAALLNRGRGGPAAWLAVGLAVLFALLDPLFLLELGNTFNEISTGVLVAAGWYLLLREFDTLRHRYVALAGLLIGMGVALKLTNGVYSITALPLILLAPAAWRRRLQAGAVFAVAGLAGSLLAGGWWAWQLQQAFGSPFFPLFNHIFHAPGFSEAFAAHQRFLPQSAAEFLMKPFAMALPDGRVHTESVAPDLRYGALLLALAWLGVQRLAARLRVRAPGVPLPAAQGERALWALSLGFAAAWVLWLASSGNGRYLLPMSGMGAVILASALARVGSSWRVLAYGGASLALVQGAMVMASAELRWAPVGWGKSWLELDIPAPLQRQPSLYLHMGTQSASFLLPFLPPGSGMINASGTWIVEETPAMRALLARHAGRTRVMRRFFSDALPSAELMGTGLVRFGLEADMDSCQPIRLRHRLKDASGNIDLYYMSCAVRPLRWTAQRMQSYLSSKRRADAVFDRIEAACPRHFQPRGVDSEAGEAGFSRNYSSTDIILRVSGSGVVSFNNHFRRSEWREIGHIDRLEQVLPDPRAFCTPLGPAR